MDEFKVSVSHRAPLNNGRGKLRQREQTFIFAHTEVRDKRPLPLAMERCVEAFKYQRYVAVEAATICLQVSGNHFPVT